ncbi:hypothetical protein WIC93_08070 [Enterobacter cloacae]|nr:MULTISPECIES: hypothetical protein [Enterobacter]EKM5717283.1 hypothetical protein [Enterobacter cloacae]EKP1124195.1 hypothetical protein [Enterobacter cloacae]EKU2768161.1 hypothetical protein [Enterobacter cloacae]EKV7706617.1 hypothetical protein [Enterobacter cloacae]ELQ9034875.1 hypothetical protein [Enterobacter cloacae]
MAEDIKFVGGDHHTRMGLGQRLTAMLEVSMLVGLKMDKCHLYAIVK